MTVRQNLGYGLKVRKRSIPYIREKVDALMQRLGIAHLQDRHPLFLSGGEKQRVALGRALITDPGILLLDEPLSALDENLRSQLAKELRRIQRDSHRTFLHVCHSFDEASFVADRIAIMREGVIEQVGTIQEIMAKPSGLFIAEFTRMQNFNEGIAETVNGKCRITTPSGTVIYSNNAVFSGPVTFGIRPEEIVMTSDSTDADKENHLKATVTQVRFRPSFREVELDAGFPLIAYCQWNGDSSEHIAEGKERWIHFRPEAVAVFRKNNGMSGESNYYRLRR
jgi:ABC-type Fe3+/spermidine/putrescine transport system ATPase subunit